MRDLRRLSGREPRARVAVYGLVGGWSPSGHYFELREEEGRYEFMVVGLPLRLPGGTGSPWNPLAIF